MASKVKQNNKQEKKKSKENPEREVLGLVEEVTLINPSGKEKIVKGRVDTGASSSSISIKIARELGLGPITKVKTIKSANGRSRRPFVECKLRVKGKTIKVHASLSQREHMKYPVLIGRNALRRLGFLIDPLKETQKSNKKDKIFN